MTKPENATHPLIYEVEARMQAQLVGNPATLIASLEQQIQIGENNLRPTMTLLFGDIFSVPQDTLINLAASIEMLHHAKLVHDSLASKTNRTNSNAAFLTSANVLAGDLAFAAAASLAAAPQSTAVMRIFSNTLQLMVSGEITHMFQNGSGFVSEAYYDRIHATTASLFELAGEAAAILGSAEVKTIKAVRQFGHEIGMAYQIVEDALDFVANPEIRDKPTGQNLRQGIITLPTIYYHEIHPNDPDIRSIISRNGHHPEVIDRVIGAISNSGVIEQTFDEAKTYVQRGLDILANFPTAPERVKLELLATQIIPNNR